MIYLTYYLAIALIAAMIILFVAHKNQSKTYKEDKVKTVFIAVFACGLVWPIWAAALIAALIDVLREVIHEITRP